MIELVTDLCNESNMNCYLNAALPSAMGADAQDEENLQSFRHKTTLDQWTDHRKATSDQWTDNRKATSDQWTDHGKATSDQWADHRKDSHEDVHSNNTQTMKRVISESNQTYRWRNKSETKEHKYIFSPETPFQIGGLAHPTPEAAHFGWTEEATRGVGFLGCIKNLRINNQVADVIPHQKQNMNIISKKCLIFAYIQQFRESL